LLACLRYAELNPGKVDIVASSLECVGRFISSAQGLNGISSLVIASHCGWSVFLEGLVKLVMFVAIFIFYTEHPCLAIF
jgi:hypothetical protein